MRFSSTLGKVSAFAFGLTDNFDGVVYAKLVTLLCLSAAVVNALVSLRHRREDKVVVLPNARRPKRKLFTIFEPPGYWWGAARQDALQR